MRIVFYGDSITDMGRNRNGDKNASGYGFGYPNFIAGDLLYEAPEKYDIINRGISGNRIVDLYARVKADVWNLEPDVWSILIGINDIWHELGGKNGVDIVRFEKVYRMLLADTKERFPNLKIMLCEPFVLEGTATSGNMEAFLEIKEYAKVVKKLADEFGCAFVPLQKAFDEAAAKHGAAYYLYDGVHPDSAGARLIANEWLKVFKTIE